VGNSVVKLLHPLAKNYQNIMRFDKFITKIIGCNFLPHSVVSIAGDGRLQDILHFVTAAWNHIL